MKKALRIILSVFLAVVVAGCLIWYLFVYDRDFTRDLLLYQARFFERQGNHAAASWFYDRAYSQADQDEDVAIELAEQYKMAGNYTKAEYTLSHAIADHGSAKLYVALCKTYVEQDKLLDAVDLLNNVADPVIRQELDDMRPQAPAADPEPGFYTSYVSVSLTAPSGTLYVTTSGEYPSVSDAPYTQPLTMPGGETVIYALAVADNGLVSPLAIYGYTIGGVIEPVELADPAMEAAIRAILGVRDDAVLYTNDLWQITSLAVPENVQTYSDLAYLPYLRQLSITNGVPDELRYLSGLSVLEELALYKCSPTPEEMTVIGALPALKKLTLADCGLSTIEALSTAQGLTYLDLQSNNLRTLAPITGMQALQELNLSHNAVTDLSEISALNLTTLNVSYNSLTSIAPISAMPTLTWLDVSHNTLTSLGAVNNLKDLAYLNASYNRLTDVSALSQCLELSILNISNNSISGISDLSSLVKLMELYFSDNQVTALPALPASCALVIIDGSHNQLSSLEPLSGMEHLNKVLMDYNQEIASIDCLATCHNLYQVNVFATNVTDASALTKLSIIVNFDPSTARGGETEPEDGE